MTEAPASAISSNPASPHLECPPWCTARHSPPDHAYSHHAATETCFKPNDGRLLTNVTTHALATSDRHWERVFVSGFTLGANQNLVWPRLFLDADDAESLAGLLDVLTAFTPRQHREFAASIRQNAALIKDSSGGQA